MVCAQRGPADLTQGKRQQHQGQDYAPKQHSGPQARSAAQQGPSTRPQLDQQLYVYAGHAQVDLWGSVARADAAGLPPLQRDILRARRQLQLQPATVALDGLRLAVDGQGLHLRTLGQRQRVRTTSARAQPQAQPGIRRAQPRI